MKKKWLFLLTITAVLVTLIPMTTYADETSGNATGFTYESIKPENQRDKSAGYFDLKMTPGQTRMALLKL
jgi:hypothetical protein